MWTSDRCREAVRILRATARDVKASETYDQSEWHRCGAPGCWAGQAARRIVERRVEELAGV